MKKMITVLSVLALSSALYAAKNCGCQKDDAACQVNCAQKTAKAVNDAAALLKKTDKKSLKKQGKAALKEAAANSVQNAAAANQDQTPAPKAQAEEKMTQTKAQVTAKKEQAKEQAKETKKAAKEEVAAWKKLGK